MNPIWIAIAASSMSSHNNNSINKTPYKTVKVTEVYTWDKFISSCVAKILFIILVFWISFKIIPLLPLLASSLVASSSIVKYIIIANPFVITFMSVITSIGDYSRIGKKTTKYEKEYIYEERKA